MVFPLKYDANISAMLLIYSAQLNSNYICTYLSECRIHTLQITGGILSKIVMTKNCNQEFFKGIYKEILVRLLSVVL